MRKPDVRRYMIVEDATGFVELSDLAWSEAVEACYALNAEDESFSIARDREATDYAAQGML